MRVLLFRTLCDSGGVSTSMLLLARQLEARGIECDFWFCRPSNRLPEFLATGRATLAPLPALCARLQRGDYDVVHMTASDPAAELVSLMAGPARVIVTARGALADNWHAHNCFAFTAISVAMAALNQPLTELEVEVVRNSIDPDHWAPPAHREDGAPIIAFVGRSTALEKDFPRFTRIARRVAAHGVRIWIADPHDAARDMPPDPSWAPLDIERWQRVPHADMPEFYRAIAASGGTVVMCSRAEGFGNAAAEAAACGATVVAPELMGFRESVVPDVTGTLYPADASDDEVARRVLDWIGTAHDIEACAATARHEFSPSVMAERYIAIYERPQQRVVAVRPPASTAPEMAGLTEHLALQRHWRSQASVATARELAAAGYADLAVSALRLAFSAEPGHLFTRVGAQRAASAALRIARRPRRLLRLGGVQRPPAATAAT